MVAHTGFEPVIFALRGRCPGPLDECATQMAAARPLPSIAMREPAAKQSPGVRGRSGRMRHDEYRCPMVSSFLTLSYDARAALRGHDGTDAKGGRDMATKVLRRPEVRLGACNQDGCMLLRQYGEVDQQMTCTVWECVSC